MHDFDIEHCLFKQSEVALVENQDTWCPFLALIMHPVRGRIEKPVGEAPTLIGHFLNENSNSLKLLRGLSAQKQTWQSCINSRGPVRCLEAVIVLSHESAVFGSKFIEPADTAYVTKICYL